MPNTGEMNGEATIKRLRRILLHRRQLLAEGATDAQLAVRVRRGDLVRVAIGWYASGEDWHGADATDRHLLRALAVEQNAQRPPVFSHSSAALLQQLPTLRIDPHRVHTLAPAGMRSSSRHHLARHHADFSDDELVTVAGLHCTDPTRTTIDIARLMGLEAGLVCADAVESGGVGHARAQMLKRLNRLPNGNGSRRARVTLEFASALAESPLESMSRLQLARLGFEVREQVSVPAHGGGEYRIDFELIGYETFLEVDGRVEYTDEHMRSGRSLDELLIEEKQREDWIRGTTGYRCIRSSWQHSQSPGSMAQRLIAFGIRPPAWPGPASRIDLY